MIENVYSFLFNDGKLHDNIKTLISYVKLLRNFLEFCDELGLGSKENEIFGSKIYIDLEEYHGQAIHKIIRIFQYLNINEDILNEYDEALKTIDLFLNKLRTYDKKDFLFKEFLISDLKNFEEKLYNFYKFLLNHKRLLKEDYENRIKFVKDIKSEYKNLKKEYMSFLKRVNKYFCLVNNNIRNIFLLREFEKLLLKFYNKQIDENILRRELKEFYNSNYYWILENDENKEIISSKEINEKNDIIILEKESIKVFMDSLIEFVKKLKSI